MRKKFGLVCLSVMVIALAISCSSNRSASAKTTASESSIESLSEERTRRKEDSNSSSDDSLSVGESSVVSKNIINSNEKVTQENVTITLNNVIKCDKAKNEVANYNSSNKTSKIPQLVDDSLQYVIIEYTTVLPKDSKSTGNGQSSQVAIQVCNVDGSSLISNDNNYILRTINFEISEELQAGDTGVTRTVITLPKNITEFIVKLGDNPSNMSSYLIK